MDEPDVVVETLIEAPADRLYAMVSDVTRMGEWSPEATGGVWKGGADGPVVGARFSGRNRNGRRRWSTACTVTEAEPGRAFAFASSAVGLKVATWRYRFEPVDGGTRVTEEWFDDRGTIARVMGGPASGVADRAPHNRAGMEETLRRLKAAAEA